MLTAENKLIDLRAGKGLDSGLMPSVLPSAGAPWMTGRQVWFQETQFGQALGTEVLIPNTHRKCKAMAQAFTGAPRLYYEDLGIISYYQDGDVTLIGELDANGEYDLVPWGEWLAMTDNVDQPVLWKGAGAPVPIGVGQFTRAKILKKLGQHLLAINTDTFPAGIHWSSASAPEDWEPSPINSAGFVPIRDLDSEIVAAVDLGAALGLYSREYMLTFGYVGYPNWFGTPTQALSGIGAVSKDSVVSLGRDNWGLCRGGIFLTNGVSFTYVDRPAVSRWLQETVDWERSNSIAGHYDEQMDLIVWSVPTKTGDIAEIAVHPKNRSAIVESGQRKFTFLGSEVGVGIERGVFNYPIVARDDGIYFNSVFGKSPGDFFLASHLFDGGDKIANKSWEYMQVEGEFTDAEVRIGFSDDPNHETVDWTDWQPLKYRVPFGPRESMYLALEFKSVADIKVCGITVYGRKAGSEA